ncbi:MAG: ParB/RepB/Spo0J family partition protein [Desulfurellales bacterium]|nr:MAG: ParB/RepB/Spo0J family partition protein [Desulfurellales bacterium]
MPEDYNVQMLELEEIQPSPTNPRTRFSEEALADLAESIRQKGVMQPILVRPRRCDFRIEAAGNRWAVLNATGVTLETCDTEEDAQDAMRLFWERQPQFELVAGERRWRASKLAGEETIPAIVRQLSDLSALEFQVVENLQRADLSAMEEAEGYRRMTRDYGYTVESLAEKIGKSKAYVYARLKLAEQLPPQAIEALERGQFSTSVAELIARLPSEKAREEMTEELLEDANDPWWTCAPVREVKRRIESSYMRELKAATWSLDDKKLLPEAGSCKACPKRTGNDRLAYPDSRADICTDPSCFAAKALAQKQREIAEMAAQAQAPVLPAEEAKELLGWGGLTPTGAARYVSLDEEHWDVRETVEGDRWTPRTYGEILGDGVEVAAIAIDKGGAPHRLVLREAVEAQLVEKGVKLDPASALRQADEETQRAAQRAEEERRTRLLAEASRKAARFYAEAFDEHCLLSAEMFRGLAADLLPGLAQVAGAPALRAIAARRGISLEAGAAYEDLANLETGGEVLGMLAEVAVAIRLRAWHRGYGAPEASHVLDVADVDLQELERQELERQELERQELEAEAAAGPKASAPKRNRARKGAAQEAA